MRIKLLKVVYLVGYFFLRMGHHQMAFSSPGGAEWSVRFSLTKTHPCSSECPLPARAAVTFSNIFRNLGSAPLAGPVYYADISLRRARGTPRAVLIRGPF